MTQAWRTKVAIRQGDLTDAKVDAIVNAANNDLLLGGGVAGAIRIKGGPSIQEECSRLGPIRIGEAAMTSGGKLAARLSFTLRAWRSAVIRWRRDCARRRAIRLARAEEKRLESIAFPAIGTGIAGFPMDRCAEVMLEEIRTHLTGETTLQRVEIVLFDAPSFEVFEHTFAEMND